MNKNHNYNNINSLDFFELLIFIYKQKIYFLYFFLIYLLVSLISIIFLENKLHYVGLIEPRNTNDINVGENDKIYIYYPHILDTDLMYESQRPNIEFSLYKDTDKHFMAQGDLFNLYVKTLLSNLKNNSKFKNNDFTLEFKQTDDFYTVIGTFKTSIGDPKKIYQELYLETNKQTYEELIIIYNNFIDKLISKIDNYVFLVKNIKLSNKLSTKELECRIDFFEKHFKLSKHYLSILDSHEQQLLKENYDKYNCLQNLWRKDHYQLGKNFIKNNLIEVYLVYFDDTYYLDQINFYKSKKQLLIKEKKSIEKLIRDEKIYFSANQINFVRETNIKFNLLLIFIILSSIILFYISVRFSNLEIKK